MSAELSGSGKEMHLSCNRYGLPMRSGSRLATLVAVAGFTFLSGAACAEEGGSGHYLPGSIASFIDGTPPTETFVTRLNVIQYKGSVSAQQPLPIAGVNTLGLNASSWGYGLTLLWRPPVELGERWSYAMSTTIPFLSMDVSANAAAALPGGPAGTIGRTSNTDAVGDVVLIPLMLSYIVNPDFKLDFRVAAYAPTGSYQVGRLANTGKNFWTIEPTAGFLYFGQKSGIEASLFVGADFNQENKDTNYKSGTQAHMDGTLAQHFPFAGGLAGAGLSAYYYQQVGADSGSGATLGAFKGKSVGIGPAVSYVSKLGKHDMIMELKWLHETSTENRLKGDIVWFKAVLKF